MATVNLKTDPRVDWNKTILSHYPFLPYWWIDGTTLKSRQSLLGRALDRAQSKKRACVVGYVSREGEMLGFSQATRLAWDTRHFGCEIWRLEHMGAWGELPSREAVACALIRETIRVAGELGCRCIQARIPVDNLVAIHALERAGFKTMEVYSTWVFDLLKWEIPPKRNPRMIRDFRPSDADALIQLARSSYNRIPDRFHMDPHFPEDASNELYAQWIRNSCSGELADFIAVAESEGRIIAYATLRDFGDYDGLSNVRIAQLGLGAVLPDFRNRGLVSDLVIHNMEWLNRRHGRFSLIATQGNNIPAQRLFLNAGFKPATTALTLHYWEGD